MPLDPDAAARLVSAGATVSLEQYRRLAAVLHETQVQQGLKTLMVTSALPGDGKTLTAVNLALTLTESYGRRVLLIDADLRRPAVHSVLGLSSSPGLGDVLSSESAQLPLIHFSSLLTVMPAGASGASPVAGLASERMRQLLRECASRFDWVLVDTPPVGLLPDAQLLANLIGAVVLVIRAGSTPFHMVERAVAELGRESIVGTVLNGVDEDSISATNYYNEYS